MTSFRVFLAAALSAAASLMKAEGPTASPFPRTLPIPPILGPSSTSGGVDHYELTARAGQTRFFANRATPSYGYNGMGYLGPTIRLTRGRPASITIRNELPADGPLPAPMRMSGHVMPVADAPTIANATSLHLHGLVAHATADTAPSGCCAAIPPGASASTSVFMPDQPAATLWYHPHPYLDTGRQIYWGLAGLLLLDDPADAALNLPHAYGVDDLPLIVQDRRFKADWAFAFRIGKEDEEGVLGDHILVNGALAPHADVAATRVRMRLVNASNARAYLFALSDGRTFQQIATDGGLLPAPATVDQVLVPAGGRSEIVVDFSGDSGRPLYLVSRSFPAHVEADDFSLPNGSHFVLMEFRVGAPKASCPVPARLASLSAPDGSRAVLTRRFDLERGSDGTINGKRFDRHRMDERVKAGAWEVWTVTNHAADVAHPFHVHGIQFRVLDRNTGPLLPNDQGWKDTVNIVPHETVRLLLHFDKQSGAYMYHCHILEHEDMGMMGTYEVGK
ncbi:MAG TPA: multicopper oxidase domain-containing protein [Holophagaceae bacterium]|jgi:blue copper oxidase|nr:multicopper oxidase domain-containing protein [Holophagaceae bacterium]